MRPYGKKKTKARPGMPKGHNECPICHPPVKNEKSKARREGKKSANEAE